jgi:hypothetical protein
MLNWLMSRYIFSHSNGIMGHDIDHTCLTESRDMRCILK